MAGGSNDKTCLSEEESRVSVSNGSAPQHVEEEERTERGTWGNKLDFAMSCIAYAVGLGNVWRFPYLCHKNGGGAFLIPYFIAMISCGIPLFFLEVLVGQYLGVGGMRVVGQLCPLFTGIGYASLTMVFLECIYYIIIVSWTLFYFVASFVAIPHVPWVGCNNTWASENCTEVTLENMEIISSNTSQIITPVEEFWNNRVLKLTEGFEDMGTLQWELAGLLLVAWIIVYFIVWQGLFKSGKIVWFSAIFPYTVLLVLFFRGVTLEGAADGLWYFITPEWEKLMTAQPWIDGGTQIFYSYGVGIGALLALGSYNKFHHNCYKDVIIVCCINSFTSMFAGIVTFSVVGHMAFKGGVPVEDIVRSGPGLAFVAFPEVVNQLPGAPFWAALFFLMLMTLGVNSQFCCVESFITGMVDNWPTLLKHRRKFTLGSCILMYLMGLPMVMEGGMYIFQLMDFYCASGMSLLWTCFFQTVAIVWIFGGKRLYDCLDEMIGFRPTRIWLFCWYFTAPAFMMFIFIFYFIRYETIRYGETYTYPWWGELLGFLISLSSMVCLPIYFIYYVYLHRGKPLIQIVREGLKPQITHRADSDWNTQGVLLGNDTSV